MTTKAVGDVMTRDVVTVRSFAPFRALATTMLRRRIGAVPVVDSMGHAIGVVSRTDLIAKEASGTDAPSELWELLSRRGRQVRERGRATTAARLMTANLVTVTPDTDINHAAYLMERHNISHLPVVDARDVVVGIVSRSDLLGAYLRDDDEIRAEVIRSVAQCFPDEVSDAVSVSVTNGIVTLTGEAREESASADVAVAARAVRGVVDVVDKRQVEVSDHAATDRYYPGPLL
ncbi:MAG: CBS domain-containing protein [Actinocrinis sp.]